MPFDEWDPFRELINLRNRFDELFERQLSSAFLGGNAPRPTWAPPVDVFEDGAHLVVQAEIPGVDESSISVEYHDQVLAIRGERPTVGEGARSYHRIERQHGPFERLVRVDAPVDVDAIAARFEAGVLTVRLPVRKPGGRTIPVGDGEGGR
jgi:HSP20 family protein